MFHGTNMSVSRDLRLNHLKVDNASMVPIYEYGHLPTPSSSNARQGNIAFERLIDDENNPEFVIIPDFNGLLKYFDGSTWQSIPAGRSMHGSDTFVGFPAGPDYHSPTYSGYWNTGFGAFTLFRVTSGHNNTGVGAVALSDTTTGTYNVAVGQAALGRNTTGSLNTAIGYLSHVLNTSGSNNTSLGALSAVYSLTGSDNISIGYRAGFNFAGAESNNITIGNEGIVGDNSTIRIGTAGTHTKFFAAGIQGVITDVNDAIPVLIASNGQLGTASSSLRYKENVADMEDSFGNVLDLRPVSFVYKDDKTKSKRAGLIAEEVEKCIPYLVVKNAQGEPETVKYQELSVLLLNELKRQNKRIEELEKKLAKTN